MRDAARRESNDDLRSQTPKLAGHRTYLDQSQRLFELLSVTPESHSGPRRVKCLRAAHAMRGRAHMLWISSTATAPRSRRPSRERFRRKTPLYRRVGRARGGLFGHIEAFFSAGCRWREKECALAKFEAWLAGSHSSLRSRAARGAYSLAAPEVSPKTLYAIRRAS
jgi:hypothetical protein